MSRLFARLGNAFVAPPSHVAGRAPEEVGAGRAAEEVGAGRAAAEVGAGRAAEEVGGGRAAEEVGEGRAAEEVGAGRAAEDVGGVAGASVAVLCRPADALVAGGAAALAVAGRSGSPCALLLLWGAPERGPRAPALGAARRLATRAGVRGHDAFATGRVAVVRLRGDLGEAAAEAGRVIAAAGEAPTVAVLAGPRAACADDLLRAQDTILVATPPDAEAAVAVLAVRGLDPLGVPARAVALAPAAAHARGLAAAGVALVPPLRGPFEAVLRRHAPAAEP